MKKIFLPIFCFFLISISCSEKDQIYRLKLEREYYDSTEYFEYFVINNPSKNKDTILKHVKEYNRLWLPKQSDKLKKSNIYVQKFYEETWSIDRNYRPFQLFFEMDDIREFDSHSDDFILEVRIKGDLEYFDLESKKHFKIPAPNYSFWNHKGIGKNEGKY